MDDFGTGYSSLSCLRNLPIDVLKIDRSFLVDVVTRNDASALINSIVTLAHDLGISVVAEGLETPDQVACLQVLNCDNAQGYFFGKPMPAELAVQFLQTAQIALAA
jgi:EAL domain-containing protein (putative c-di-GMP-specific phosphodiesterase class I)